MNYNGTNGTLTPDNLTCEQLKEPMGICMPNPRFSYIVPYGKAGAYQTSCRIRVATTLDGLIAPDMWDGVIEGNRTSLIDYAGETLASFKRYYWNVEVTDQAGQSALSEPACFTTGIIAPQQWQAQFLSANSFGYAHNRALYCRADFTVSKPARNAYMLICGLGYHVLTINGQRQGDAVLEPGFTTFNERVQYIMHDITPCLNEGTNTLGVVLGEGWYNNKHEVFDRYSFLKPLPWLGQPRFSYQIYIEYEDGSTELRLSDQNAGVTVGSGPIVFNDVFNGEHYDARLARPGWDTPAATGCERFAPAEVIAAPCAIIEPELAEPIKVVKHISPVALSEPQPGVYVFDFGQNFAGWVRLQTAAPRGTQIHLRFAEMLYQDGTINQENLRWAKNHDFYITAGGEETYEPSFTYHGFRYVQLEGIVPSIDTLTGCVVRSAVELTGDFSCASELLNQIQQCVLWTEESNLHSVPTDCPQRDERQGWMNDGTVRMEETVYNFGMGAFQRKWQKDMTDTQEADGSIKDVAPRVFGGDKADPLSSVFLIVPWLNYMFYGDKRIIEENYDAMQAWEAYLTTRSTFGIMDYFSYGDWAGPVEGGVGGPESNSALSAITPGQFVATIFYYLNAIMLADMARLIGKNEDIQKYLDLAEYIKTSINRVYFHPDTAQYALGSQGSNILALHFDIVPKQYRDRVLNNLVADIAAHDYHLTTGNIATKYLFEVLSDNGLVDVAYKIATQQDYPSWGFMLKKGATTIWERWEHGTTNAMNSHNHPMYGTISTWFYKHLGGISPLAPAFEEIRIAPKLPTDLAHASAVLHTVRGKVTSNWKRTEDGLLMDIVLPFGSTGCIHIPEGYQIYQINGETYTKNDTVLHVVTGRYRLSLKAL